MPSPPSSRPARASFVQGKRNERSNPGMQNCPGIARRTDRGKGEAGVGVELARRWWKKDRSFVEITRLLYVDL
jgi:hypothetical protein